MGNVTFTVTASLVAWFPFVFIGGSTSTGASAFFAVVPAAVLELDPVVDEPLLPKLRPDEVELVAVVDEPLLPKPKPDEVELDPVVDELLLPKPKPDEVEDAPNWKVMSNVYRL